MKSKSNYTFRKRLEKLNKLLKKKIACLIQSIKKKENRMQNNEKKLVMEWSKDDVAHWVTQVSIEREMPDCGHIFAEKGIDGQRLWDYSKYQNLKEIDVPTVGMRLILTQKIENLCGDFHQ